MACLYGQTRSWYFVWKGRTIHLSEENNKAKKRSGDQLFTVWLTLLSKTAFLLRNNIIAFVTSCLHRGSKTLYNPYNLVSYSSVYIFVNSYTFLYIKIIRNTIYLQTKEFKTLRSGISCKKTATFWDCSGETLPGNGNNARIDAEMNMKQHNPPRKQKTNSLTTDCS